MQRFFILRLDKDIRSCLERERTRLYQISGDSSFFSFEPLIVLGAVEGPIPPFVPCPPLPIVTQAAHYDQGTLYLPIDEKILRPLREVCNTTWPTSGIYLGDIDVPVEVVPLSLKYLRFGLLNVQKVDQIFRWHISEERSLDSDKGGR